MSRRLAALAVLLLANPTSAESLRRLAGSRPGDLAGVEPLGRAPAALPIEPVTIVLGLRHRATLDAVIAAQGDRRSPRFRHWLGAAEIADRFGPSRAEYERLRGWLVERGFAVVRESPFRVTLAVAGTAGQIEAALATPIGLFRRGGRVHHAPLLEPALPESLAGSVRGILGLDDFPKFRPLVQLGNGQMALAPADFAAAYDVQTLQAAGLTGAGGSIAVIARSNFADSDIAAFSARFLPTPLAPVRVFTGNIDPGVLPEEGEQIEVLLDTQWAGSLAPGAALNVLIGSPRGNIPEALEGAIVNRSRELPSGDVISISFGLCELVEGGRLLAEFFDYLYAIANAQGQTVLVAAGDSGAMDCLPNRRDLAVNGLAASPHAVAIGGTSFRLDANGVVPTVLSEATWNDRFGAGGGGRSVVLAMPPFQLAAGLAVLGPGRVLPDLSLAASPGTPGYVIVQEGRERVVGGTSAGVPAFASVLALVNQRLAAARGIAGGLGQLTPDLHRLGNEQTRGLRAPVFRDVAAGDIRGFDAGSGFDLATGWGAPLGGALAEALDGPGRCEPLIDALRPQAGCLVPAGRRWRGCTGEWLVELGRFALDRNVPARHQTCRDGDPACDADGAADGTCTVRVAFCVNVFDFRLLKPNAASQDFPFRCNPDRIGRVRLVAPRGRDATQAANRSVLLGALAGLPLPTALTDACTATVPVVVPIGSRLALRARTTGSLGAKTARVSLSCAA